MAALCLGRGERRRSGLNRSWQRSRPVAKEVVAHDTRKQDGESGALPVIRGSRWFGPEQKQFVLRAEIPVTFDEMVAALYGTAQADDIANTEDLCGTVVVAVLVEGLGALESRAERLRRDELAAGVESPTFLSLCRRHAAGLTVNH